MISERIAWRNRANAQKSTGPKTARGKAVVAGNARRHGATARPNSQSVATWLAIILDHPDISPGQFTPDDERGFCALALAEAEVRLVAAERALHAFESGDAEPSADIRNLKKIAEAALVALEHGQVSKPQFQKPPTFLRRLERLELDETGWDGKRHRLLKRYLGEARSQKRRALAAWLSVMKRDGEGGLQSAQYGDFPKQSQLHG